MANNLAEQLESPEFNDELSRQLDNVIALPLSQENKRKVSDKIKEIINNPEKQEKINELLKNALNKEAANDDGIAEDIDEIDLEPANDNELIQNDDQEPTKRPVLKAPPSQKTDDRQDPYEQPEELGNEGPTEDEMKN